VANLRERLVFYGQALKAADEVGAFTATSRAVAEALARPIAPGPEPLRVLEAGAGAGHITQAIARRLRPEDRLDVSEINPRFVELLEERFAGRTGGPDVRVFGGDILALPVEAPYDAIVSTLPLLNMDPALVERVFDFYFEHLKPTGSLVYYDYWAKGLRRLVTPSRSERRRMSAVLRVTRGVLERHEVDRRVIVRNLPPACVHVLRGGRGGQERAAEGDLAAAS